MYLGGNGFYWVIGYHPQRPGIIEVRRGENGSESWVPEPGEKYHGFTGEKGGLWRERGWPPNRLVGVGTSGMWEPVCTGYRRQPDSHDPATAFVFEGVEGETFGDFGLLGGGAAGQEIDRYDTSWGSPEHAYLLASSEGHTEHERRVVEELPGNEPFTDGRMDPKVRADVVYYRTPNGGAVFTTGSMAWIGSLAHDDYDNDVSRITGNVLAAFASDGPLPDGDGGSGEREDG
jgi:N,N-dimethylformamidase